MVADAKRKEARKRKFGAVQDTSAALISKAKSNSRHGIAPSKPPPNLNDSADESLPQWFLRGPKYNASDPDATDPNAIDPEAFGTHSLPKAPRFICFVGNLPYTATETSIAQHFTKLRPIAIRHRTIKETGRSRGFAFVEFDGYDRMKTCLQAYHHSVFDDGISPCRKINVELTAGGGGAKSEERKYKLLNKNEKLDEQRNRRALEEGKSTRSHMDPSDDQIPNPADESAIHPTRRKMVIRG